MILVSSNYISTSALCDPNYIAHYGIKGQKWGVRRFRNPDGTLTAEGRRRARKEYKADNKEAFQKGKTATLSARAADYAEKRYERSKRFSVNPGKIARRKENAEYWREQASRSEQDVKKHYDSLVSKYGKDAISSVNRDKKGRINERVHTGKTKFGLIAGSALMYVGFSLLGSPISPLVLPSSREGYARRMVRAREKSVREAGRVQW